MFRQDQVSASLLKRQGLLVFAFAILICLTRRPNQLLSAGVWVEEGALFIPQFLENGLGFLFDPVNGYVIVPSKIVALLSYLVSFQYYPEVSLFFTLIFSGLVSLAILKSPTVIKHKPLAALAPFLVPSDPEVVAVGEYIFWHTSLCAALSALWCANAGAQRFRNLLVVIGGLSSPFIVALLPVFFFRTLFYRTKAEIFTLATATVVSALQLWLVFSSGQTDSVEGLVAQLVNAPVQTTAMLIEKFVGDYFINVNAWLSLMVGVIALVSIAAFAVWSIRRSDSGGVWLLLVLGATAISALRVDIAFIDAATTAPRYFYLTYVALSWTLLYAIAQNGSLIRSISAAGIALWFGNLSWQYVRPHFHLDWRSSVQACITNSAITPVRFTGRATSWPGTSTSVSLAGDASEAATNRHVESRAAARGTGRADRLTGKIVLNFQDSGLDAAAVEIIFGPSRENISILVERTDGTSSSYAGSDFPSSAESWTWYGFEAPARITISDEGPDWGQWVAVNSEARRAEQASFKRVYDLPVHFAGRNGKHWTFELTHDQCQHFERLSIF